jgi:hypothetical protein
MNVKSPGNTIAISHLVPGVYIVTIERKDGTKKSVKILKQ